MSDAGEGNDRANLASGRDGKDPNSGSEPASGSLSKRAARRRRKRRPPAGNAQADKARVGNAPTAGDKAPERTESASGTKSGGSSTSTGKTKTAGGRRRRKRGGQAGAQKAALRGMRKPGQGNPEARGEGGRQGGEGRARKGGERRGGSDVATEARAPQPQAHRQESRSGADQVVPIRRSGPVHGDGPLYAALDLGTNNCRLLVAEPQDRGFRVVDAYSRIVRLGEGIGRTGRLSEAAMDRAVEALAVCRSKLADLKVRRMRLIATEACRQAENGPVFLERVRKETGLRLEIVSRETEARLAVAGCATLIDPKAEGVLLFDIGGGSSELVWLDLRAKGEARGFALTRFISKWTSLPVGVVTLSERHGGHIVTEDVYQDMVREVEGMLEGFEGMEGAMELVANGRAHMLGTSGTVTTLAGMHLGLKRYDRRRVDGVWLDGGQVDGMIRALLDMGYDQRVANPCIGADRADLVLAGCAILEAIRRKWPCERLRVADRGLREGILVELMAHDGVWRRRAHAARGEQHG
ncbi:Ppx/GppA phosphatase family protein [Oryzibacter oryziterrae]|uniref:Ppx/GppA phosphatase family protein n=1 Tax=Oryzibacter oryziterrae TaxID=2766474 RepID=UPI001F41A6F2|nr:Ppx/GppA phosphatase family protein [Oryzibacter oryziterrae]